jgi:hypothetical protein
MWWFWLSLMFGGTPVQWVISVGMFSGCILGMYALYRLAKEEPR